MSIKKKVDQLVKKYGTSNPFELARALDIEVIFEPLGDSLGYFSRFNRTAIIHINESLPYKKQMATCSHELGHVILHPDTNVAFLKLNTYFPTSKVETEANEFMIELLFNQETTNTITVYEAKTSYGIPVELLKCLEVKKTNFEKNVHFHLRR